jgi:Protein of unknown function (DUF2815)
MAGLMTPIGFLYYPHFFTPTVNKKTNNPEARFSGMLLLDDAGLATSQYQALRQGVFDAIVGKFGQAKANDPQFVSSLRLPFRAAAEKTYKGFADGKIFISAWRKDKDGAPGVIDLQGQVVRDPKLVYGGQLARFTVNPYAYDTSGNKGVTLFLEHVLIAKFDMPRRDGGVNVEDAFVGADNAQLVALGIDPNAPTGNSPMGAAAAAVGQTVYQTPPPVAGGNTPPAGLPF